MKYYKAYTYVQGNIDVPMITWQLVNQASRPFSVTIGIYINCRTQNLFQNYIN